ncbi:MAG: flagellar biosynthetic protein FliO [Candidatus Geothermincolales bacterium]
MRFDRPSRSFPIPFPVASGGPGRPQGRSRGCLARDPWKRALVGLCALVLIMMVTSYLSSRLRGQKTALEALSTGEGTAPGVTREGEAGTTGDEGISQREGAATTPSNESVSPDRAAVAVSSTGDLPAGEPSGEEVEVAPEGSAASNEGVAREGGASGSGSAAGQGALASLPDDAGVDERNGNTASSGDVAGAIFKAFLGLAAVAALLIALRRLGPRRKRKAGLPVGEGRVEVVGFTPLGPSSGIYEVRVGDRILLIGEAERGLALLGELDAEELVTAEEAEVLEDEFLSILREEMRGVTSSPREERGSLLDELRWKTSRSGRRRRP